MQERRWARRLRRGTAVAVASAIALLGQGTGQAIAAPPGESGFHTSFEANETHQTPVVEGALTVGPDNGPDKAFVAKTNVGFTGLRALRYAGPGTAPARAELFDVDLPVTATTELSYKLFPRLMSHDLSKALPSASTYVAVDLLFTDGTSLADAGAKDQHGFSLTPKAQGDAHVLRPDHWNSVRVNIGAIAKGKVVDRILLRHHGGGGFEGWLDDLSITAVEQPSSQDPVDRVITTRGTNSNRHFSVGNTFPATAVPNGFNFWTPVTDAGTTAFLYQYQERNNSQNLPELQALGLSHQGYPWGGERHTFQFLPFDSAQGPILDRSKRALAFDHEKETAKPHLYSVETVSGIKMALTPTDHGAMAKFTFTKPDGGLLFDNVNDQGGLKFDKGTSTLSGHTLVGESKGAPMYVYATFDKPMGKAEKLVGSARPNVAGYATFDTGDDATVTMRVATSLISVEQARRNLELELPKERSFEQVQQSAKDLWNEKLSVISDVEGASHDQLTTLYSSLYRLNLYPTRTHENVGTAEQPKYTHASMHAPMGNHTAERTGAKLIPGESYQVTNFWDTYRTAWPLYALLYPDTAGKLLDGALTMFKEGGWMDTSMVGTNADATIADLYVKGIKGFDVKTAYLAVLKNATVAPIGTDAGRAGLERAQFLGYTPVSTREGFAESMENYLGDFAIANFAKKLAADPALGPDEREQLDTHAQYFLDRAQGYTKLFDHSSGFFQGRKSNGEWRVPTSSYDPRNWGTDYTETNGWGMAFSVPFDGNGLAGLYGGTKALEQKLDTFFSTPELADRPGSYGSVIHEMSEAAYVLRGQWGVSNQPAHHISYMYAYANAPSKLQAINRDALARLFVGSDIGQGYPGDEDTGEMSAWYIFGALGIYPLRVGSPEYVIGSPLFRSVTLNIEGGKKVTIKAPQNSHDNVYVHGVKVNGQAWESLSLPHDVLANGAEIAFDMGPQPSRWGQGEQARPGSISKTDSAPQPAQDLTGPTTGQAPAAPRLFDNDALTSVELAKGAAAHWSFSGKVKERALRYTITNSAAAFPSAWTLQGSVNGKEWATLDRRTGQKFQWAHQTRVFSVRTPGDYRHYRLVMDATGDVAEVELLGVSNAKTVEGLTAATSSNRVLVLPSAEASTFDVEVDLTISTPGTASISVSADAPGGWSAAPAQPSLKVVSGGRTVNQATTVTYTVPAGTAPGTYEVAVLLQIPGSSPVRVPVTVEITDKLFVKPSTTGEEHWLVDSGNSQLDGAGNRFTDGKSYATYKFVLPANTNQALATFILDNQFLVEASSDGKNWTQVLRENREIRDGSNRGAYTTDLSSHLAEDGTVWLRLSDSFPNDGWGGRLSEFEIELSATTIQVPSEIAFAPGTREESRWLYSNDGSLIGDVGQRYADGTNSFTYRFPVGTNVKSLIATLGIDNQFLVEASADGKTWHQVLREDRHVTDASNYAERDVQLAPYVGADGVVFLRFSDAFPEDGWGPRLKFLKLTQG